MKNVFAFMLFSIITTLNVVAEEVSDDELILKRIAYYTDSCGINNCGLNGNIRTMTIVKNEESDFYFPFNNFSFFIDGNFATMDYEDWGGETVSFRAIEQDADKYIYIGGQLFIARFDLFRNPHKRIVNIKDQEGGETKYTFNYDDNKTLTNITVYNSWWYDFETKERREETKSYDVTICSTDHFGNWKDIILNNGGKRSNIHRDFSYFGYPQIVYKSDTHLLYSLIDEDGDICSMRNFDLQNNASHNLMPPENERYPMPIIDYRVVNDNVYIIYMGNAFRTTEVYQYNLTKDSWIHIGQGTDDCEFGDDEIILPTYDEKINEFVIKHIKL